MGEDTFTAVVFFSIFFVGIIFPCAGASFLGKKLIDKLGRYPSRTPIIQLEILFPLIVVEVISFTILLSIFKVLCD